MELYLFGFSLLLYYFLHSLLAAESAKGILLEKIIPARWYRLFYNFVSVIFLFPIAFLFFKVEKETILELGPFRWLGLGVLLFGLYWTRQALDGYDLGAFSGTSQLKGQLDYEHKELNMSGLNAKVRHPLYFGTFLVMLGVFVLYPTNAALIVLCISTLYLIIGSKLEERKLERHFGEVYRSYQRKVPMLFPRFLNHRRK